MAATDNSSSERGHIAILHFLAGMMLGKRHGLRLDTIAAATLEVAGLGLGVVGPVLLKHLVDRLTIDETVSLEIGVVTGLFIASWGATSFMSTWRLFHSTRVIDRITTYLATAAVRSHLPAAAGRRSEGDSSKILGLLERLPYSLMIIVDGLIWRVAPLGLQVAVSLWVVCLAMPLHFALILAATIAGYGIATWVGAEVQQQRSGNANLAAVRVSGEVGDVLRNARRVIFNGTLDLEIDRLTTRLRDRMLANRKMMSSLIATSAFQYVWLSAGLTLLLILAALDVATDRSTVGAFILLQAYAFRLVIPLSGFGFILSQATMSLANLRDLMELSQDAPGKGQPVTLTGGPSPVSLNGVTFSYGSGVPILADMNVEIARGTFTVVVGPNGSGKSTLAQVMAGILKPQAGAVLIGGQDIFAVGPQERCRLALYVPQFIGLFNRTLRDNALYPPSHLTEAQLAAVLDEWRFYETGKPIDMELIVGEQGERLSGGQVQKLELARLAGIRAPVVIMDESTSAIDPKTEREMVSALKARLGATSTLVLITHRRQLAEIADLVLFMKGGRLIRHGTHKRLMTDSSVYAQFWKED